MDFKSLRTFRAELPSAFDAADDGKTVTVTRNGIQYVLRALETVLAPTQPVRVPSPSSKPRVFDLCKNGHLKGPSGKCFAKGCKYA